MKPSLAVLLTLQLCVSAEDFQQNVGHNREGKGLITDMLGLLSGFSSVVDELQDHAMGEVERMKPALEDADGELEEAMDKFKSAFDKVADSFGSGPAFSYHDRHDDTAVSSDGGVRVPEVRMPSIFAQAFGQDGPLSRNDDPLSIFGFSLNKRKPWYKGENVCVESKIFEENSGKDQEDSDPDAEVEVIDRQGKFFGLMEGNFASNIRTCSNGPNFHQCKVIQSDGTKKTTEVTRYECCYGFTRTEEGCKQLTLKSLKETVEDLQADEFESLLESAGMMELLDQNLTMFVPSNDAVEDFRHDLEEVATSVNFVQSNDVPEGNSADAITYNIDDGFSRKKRDVSEKKIRQILRGHLVPGFVSTSDVHDEDIVATIGNKHKLRINVYNTYPEKIVMANCARVTSRDHYATNGIVHVVDKVVLPAAGSIADIVDNDPELRTLSKVLANSGMAEDLKKTDGQFTVFAPTDAAFQRIEKSLLDKLLRGDGCGVDIVNNHVLPNVICSGVISTREAKARNQLKSLFDQYVTMKKDEDDVFYVNGIRVVVRDIMATNGVIHIIEQVIVPRTAITLSRAVNDRPEITNILHNTGMIDGLNDLTNVTFLIPTERSLAKLSADGVEMTRRQAMLHVVTPEMPIGLLRNNMLLKTGVDGQKIRINSYPPADVGPFGLGLLTGEAHDTYTAQCVRIAWKEKDICGGVLLEVARPIQESAPSVMAILRADHPKFSELIDGVQGLEQEIVELASGQTENDLVTIFAPVDAAFDLLSVAQLKELQSDSDTARKVVLGHIMKKFTCCAGINRRSPFLDTANKRMLSGDARVVRQSRADRFYVDNAQVTLCDKVADNGVVHAVDQVFVPVANRVAESRRTNIHRILDLLDPERRRREFDFGPRDPLSSLLGQYFQ